MCNANERVHGHGAYGRASEGELLLVDHGECLTLTHNGAALAWACRLRPCSSHKQMLCPIHAGDPDIAKPHTYIISLRVFVKSGRQIFRMFKSDWHLKSGRYILAKCLFWN